MNKYLISVLIFAALIRLLFLAKYPQAIYGDEVSIAYNAYSILQTGKDEFSKTLPIQFESWGDQKNPVYIYLVALFEVFFGLSEYAVRLPSAISGIVAVLLTYLLTKQIFLVTKSNVPQERIELIAVLASALLAINPWHILISRGGYEANLALTLGLAGVYFYFRWVQSGNNAFKTKLQKLYLPQAVLCFVLALYTYYTTKLFLPLLIILLLIFTKRATNQSWKKLFQQLLPYGIVGTLLTLPIVYLALFQGGQARFARINIFTNPEVARRVIDKRSLYQQNPQLAALLINKPSIWLEDLLTFYFDNLSAQYLYISGDSSLRYSIGNHGMLYLIELPFLLYAALTLFQKNKKAFYFLLAYLLIAPIPTALVGKSYGLRSIAILPIPMIFTAYGIVSAITLYSQSKYRKLFTSILSLIFLLSFINWTTRYFTVYQPVGYYWYDGTQKDAIQYALANSENYDRIFISKYYGKTEMYFAFYAKIPPSQYQKLSTQTVKVGGSDMVQFGKYYFGDVNFIKYSPETNVANMKTLVIASPLEPRGEETLNAKDDGRVLFKIIKW